MSWWRAVDCAAGHVSVGPAFLTFVTKKTSGNWYLKEKAMFPCPHWVKVFSLLYPLTTTCSDVKVARYYSILLPFYSKVEVKQNQDFNLMSSCSLNLNLAGWRSCKAREDNFLQLLKKTIHFRILLKLQIISSNVEAWSCTNKFAENKLVHSYRTLMCKKIFKSTCSKTANDQNAMLMNVSHPTIYT